jgi:type IV pilus assembly protein PilN
LRSLKQDGQRVSINGVAHSNERVSELLRNMSNSSPWLERPDLIEIRASTVAGKKVFDFTINVGIKRPRDKDKGTAAAVEAGANASASAPKKP